jgi:3-oxoacyl-[acyl-carrier protein] reductase
MPQGAYINIPSQGKTSLFFTTKNHTNRRSLMASIQGRQQDLTGKVAVITGASRGIGRSIAVNLASRGCAILGTCSNEQSLHHFDTISEEIKKVQDPSPNVVGIVADIYSPTCAQTIADALEQQFAKRVDIFVNNAADPNPGPIGALTVEEIQKSLVGNIQTPVIIVDELVKRKYFQPESRIIYISSIRSRQPWSQQLMYSAGKSAGESLCRTWAEAFGGKDEAVRYLYLSPFNSSKSIQHYEFDQSLVLIHGRNNRKCSYCWLDTDRLGHAMSSRCIGNLQAGVYPTAMPAPVWTT